MITEEINRFQEVQKLRSYIEALELPGRHANLFGPINRARKAALTDKNHERKEIQGGQILQYGQRDEYSRLTMQEPISCKTTWKLN